MNLYEAIRSQLTTSIKEKNEIKKSILRVVLGDLSTSKSRSGKKASEDDIKRVIKKLIEGNLETLQYAKGNNPELADKLVAENVILNSFLPKTLSRDEIKDKLEALRPMSSTMVLFNIFNAKSDGQATGVAIKYFKEQGLDVDGTDVATVVKEMRACLPSNT